jgi:hypothetical protein
MATLAGPTTVSGTVVATRTEILITSGRNLELADRDRVVACNNTSAITITIAPDSTTDFPIGSVVYISRINTGAVTLAAGAGVTLSKTGTLGTNEEIVCRKRLANNWIIVERPYNLAGSGGTASTSGNFSVNSFTTVGSSTYTVS